MLPEVRKWVVLFEPQRWRYADWGSSKDIELYDLQKDPEEYNNLANKAEFKVIVEQMKEKLKVKIDLNSK